MDNVKAIFLDMDGTILHENNQASPYTKDVINRLREKGYKVFLATGRSHSEYINLYLKILRLMASLVQMEQLEK
ncbi:HAD family hydrolase [Staphylococcus aureus]